MRDDLQQFGDNVVRQARTPGAATRGYASSVGASARTSAAPEPGYIVGNDGLPVRYFIPGRDPLYDPNNPPPYEYILGGP